jgi:hypothetical protein
MMLSDQGIGGSMPSALVFTAISMRAWRMSVCYIQQI